MKLQKTIIAQIADELDAGMKIFINRENLEFRTILDWDNAYGDNDFWNEELEKIENEWADYIVIEKLASREAFRIMESFVEEVSEPKLREDLEKILQRRSPFANFKAEVESSEYRQAWFTFRKNWHIAYVKEQLQVNDIEFEE